MSGTYFLSGSWNVICDRCGQKYKASTVRKEWTGELVCSNCWEERHPQDFLRAVPDDQTVPFARPRPADEFIQVSYGIAPDIINVGLINGFVLQGAWLIDPSP